MATALEGERLVLVQCSDRLPAISGEYDITHNCGSNNGEGRMRFSVETGWDIPDAIRSFYKVLGWYETPKP